MPELELDEQDHARLERLRAAFLASRGRSPWRDARDLEVYDATFARRIAWKWGAVIDELGRRDALVPSARVLDFGCGTGVAARSWLAGPAGGAAGEVWLHDAAPLAVEHAARAVTAQRPNLRVHRGLPPAAPDLLLVSHVLGELASAELEQLVALARGAQAVVWVEPGARETSRALAGVRDELFDAFDVLAPCTHAARCPLLAPGAEAEWCHGFARPPREVFTSSWWVKLGQRLAIDLRSVPFSFLALRKKAEGSAARAPYGGDRILGRPRIEKGRALLDACGPAGLRSLRLVARDDRAFFERLSAPEGEALLYRLAVEDGRIRAAERLV
ncbi:MAG: hypothetical protein IPJ77_13570 [Planctomycetes bacterium]|nr:hypothetical protein [Planctomycetota bacterium]